MDIGRKFCAAKDGGTRAWCYGFLHVLLIKLKLYPYVYSHLWQPVSRLVGRRLTLAWPRMCFVGLNTPDASNFYLSPGDENDQLVGKCDRSLSRWKAEKPIVFRLRNFQCLDEFSLFLNCLGYLVVGLDLLDDVQCLGFQWYFHV